MRLEDWRELPAEQVAPILEQACGRWQSELGWDARALFDLVEASRRQGELPGLVALDDNGHVTGWCYSSLQQGLLFVGALHGQRADVVRALLDEVLASPEANYARAYRCFVFPDTPAVAAALARRRFEIENFLYLSRQLPAGEPGQTALPVRPWTVADVPETARLMARAYAGTPDARCFAPGGRLDEWAAYLAQIVRTPACGTWSPSGSLASVVPVNGSGELKAAILATTLSDTTTHVAQIVVDPPFRRRGLAAALVQSAAACAARQGATRQTLLVAESNAPARALYARLGFTETTSFLFADRARISRGASAATTLSNANNV